MGETYYERLGVSPEASTDEIATAYRQKLKETHPDVSDRRDAKERTKQLIEAKEVLTDENERSRYDRLGHNRYVSLDNQSGSATSATGKTGSTSTDRATRTGPTGDRTRPTGDGRTGGGHTTSTDETSATKTNETSAASTATGTNQTRGREHSSTASSSGQEAGRANWYGGTSNSTEGSADDSGRTSRQNRSNAWRAWNTGEPYAVRSDGDTFRHGKIFSSHRAFVLLGITFLVYPVLVFGALYPQFPLGLRFAIGTCAVLFIAFLQSIPEVGIVVFGLWSLLVPVVLFSTALPLFAIESALAMVAVLFPFGLSILTRIAVRPVSV